jgi:hypothetical protein
LPAAEVVEVVDEFPPGLVVLLPAAVVGVVLLPAVDVVDDELFPHAAVAATRIAMATATPIRPGCGTTGFIWLYLLRDKPGSTESVRVDFAIVACAGIGAVNARK